MLQKKNPTTETRKKIDLSHLADKWPSSLVARTEIKNFTGGMIASGTLANLESMGIGPEGSFKVGKKRVYTVQPLIKWLEAYVTKK
jgi:hypothetical protein